MSFSPQRPAATVECAAPWRAAPVTPVAPPPRPFRRLGLRFGQVFRRDAPSTFQRCLAIHIHFAAPRGGLSL
jgi:hypothetical protein